MKRKNLKKVKDSSDCYSSSDDAIDNEVSGGSSSSSSSSSRKKEIGEDHSDPNQYSMRGLSDDDDDDDINDEDDDSEEEEEEDARPRKKKRSGRARAAPDRYFDDEAAAEAEEAEAAEDGEGKKRSRKKEAPPPRDRSAEIEALRVYETMSPEAAKAYQFDLRHFESFSNQFPVSEIFSVTIPFRVFPMNAKGFGDMNAEISEQQRVHSYKSLLALWGELYARHFRATFTKGKEDLPPPGQPKWGWFIHQDGSPTGIALPRLHMFCERLIAESGDLHGFRFWLVVHDDSFSINEAMDDLLEENRRIVASAKDRITNRRGVRDARDSISGPNAFRKIDSIGAYFNQVIRPYFGEHSQTISDVMTAGFNANMPFKTNMNPARPDRLFSLNVVADPNFTNALVASQRNISSYFKKVQAMGEEEEDDDLMDQRRFRFTFPHRVCVFGQMPSEMEADTLMSVPFPNSRASREFAQKVRSASLDVPENTDRLNPADYLYDESNVEGEALTGRERLIKNSYVRSVAAKNKEAMAAIELTTEKGTPEYFEKMLERKTTLGNTLWDALKASKDNPTNFSPALRAAMRFIERSPAGGMYPEFPTNTTNLSPHATAVSHHFEILITISEARDGATGRVLAKHHIMSIDATNPDDSGEVVPTHGMMVNDAAHGKSFVLNKIEKVSVPGSCRTITKNTENAMMTDDNPLEGMIILRHEMSLMELGLLDGKGENAVMKNAMSEGKLDHAMCQIDDETKRRRFIETTTCTRMVVLGALNESIPEHNQNRQNTTPPVLDRFWLTVSNARYTSTESSQSAALNTGTKQTPITAIRTQQFRAIHAAIILYNCYVEAGILKSPNTDEAKHTIEELIARAKKDDLKPIETRMSTSIKRMCRSMTLWVAAYLALGNEATLEYRRITVSGPNGEEKETFKPFDWTFLLLMEKFAVCSQEIIAYVMSLVEEEIVEFKRLRIISALREVITQEGGLEGLPALVGRSGRNEAAEPNHLYKTLRFDSFAGVAGRIAKKISRDMTQQTVVEQLKRMKDTNIHFEHEGDIVHIPPVMIAYNSTNARKELAVAVGLMNEDSCRGLPDMNWLMKTLEDIWSHSFAFPRRLVHAHALRNAKTGPALKLMDYIDIKRADKKRYIYKESVVNAGELFWVENGFADTFFDERDMEEMLLVVNEEHYVAAMVHAEKIGFDPEKMENLTMMNLHEKVFATRNKRPDYFKHSRVIGSYPEDFRGLASSIRSRKECDEYVKQLHENYVGWKECLEQLDGLGYGAPQHIGDRAYNMFTQFKDPEKGGVSERAQMAEIKRSAEKSRRESANSLNKIGKRKLYDRVVKKTAAPDAEADDDF